MKRKWMIPVILGISLLAASCSAAPENGEAAKKKSSTAVSGKEAYHKIDAKEAKKMMDEGKVTIVDVRTKDEFDEAHIPDAVNVPNEEIGSEQPKEFPDKDDVLIVYCRTGVRSKQASDKLVEMGYENVYDMGGIVDWTYGTESEKFRAPG